MSRIFNIIVDKPLDINIDIPQDFLSDKFQSLGYYQTNTITQTFSWVLSEDFVGEIVFQASLATSPADEEWAVIYSTDHNVKNGFYNISGNYVWLRIYVKNWFSGSISNISVAY